MTRQGGRQRALDFQKNPMCVNPWVGFNHRDPRKTRDFTNYVWYEDSEILQLRGSNVVTPTANLS